MFIKKLAKNFYEAVQFKLINLVGRIMKKRLFLKEKCKLNFCILFYHLERATKIVFLSLLFKNFVIVLVPNMLIQYVNFLITTIVIIIVLFHNIIIVIVIITVAFIEIVIFETTIVAIFKRKKCLFAVKTNSYV